MTPKKQLLHKNMTKWTEKSKFHVQLRYVLVIQLFQSKEGKWKPDYDYKNDKLAMTIKKMMTNDESIIMN